MNMIEMQIMCDRPNMWHPITEDHIVLRTPISQNGRMIVKIMSRSPDAKWSLNMNFNRFWFCRGEWIWYEWAMTNKNQHSARAIVARYKLMIYILICTVWQAGVYKTHYISEICELWYMNVKFSKGHLATLKHKSKDMEKSMSRIKKWFICFL